MILFKKSVVFIFVGLVLQTQLAKAQIIPEVNLIQNPGLEELISPKEVVLETFVGLRSLRRSTSINLDVEKILSVGVTPVHWEKFCYFNGTTYAAVGNNYARTGECYMQFGVEWNVVSNRVSPGNIAAGLHHPLVSGCKYRFGIWVARSKDDPERINNVKLKIQGLQGNAKELTYTPENLPYLEFEIPIHNMQIGEYRYFEGTFTALNEDTHIYIEVNTDEFVFDRTAKRIHRRCLTLKGGCPSIHLASIIFDDVSLVEISDCVKEFTKDSIAEPEKVEEASNSIAFPQFSIDLNEKDTASFFFQHNHPYLISEELERLRQFLREFNGRIISIQASTDSTGSYSYNRDLSLLRAKNIVEELKRMDILNQPIVLGIGVCVHHSCSSLEQCRRADIIWKPRQEDWIKTKKKKSINPSGPKETARK